MNIKNAEEKKTRIITFAVNQEDYNKISEYAKKMRMSKSDYCRVKVLCQEGSYDR